MQHVASMLLEADAVLPLFPTASSKVLRRWRDIVAARGGGGRTRFLGGFGRGSTQRSASGTEVTEFVCKPVL